MITMIVIISLISCKKDNIKKGVLYSKAKSENSLEESKLKAINNIYYSLAKYTGKYIEREDFNILASTLYDENIIDFDNANIDQTKDSKLFITEIEIKDPTLYNRTLESLEKMKKEGKVGKKVRANASIEISENAKLNAYTRQMLKQNALKRAYESLFNILIKEGSTTLESQNLTNEAYILEESYSSTNYNVVLETSLE